MIAQHSTRATHAGAWPTVGTYRACDFCVHGTGPAGDRHCTEPTTRPAGTGPQPVHLMRDYAGACGPEARFLDFPGLRC